MDILSQAVLGASLSQSFIKDKSKQLVALCIGALSGMAPDLDVLIYSSKDPLLFLEFHRQFTHSLFFIPIGALICSLVFYPFTKNKLVFTQVYVFSFMGYATHGLLDACTSYGTQLFWPITDQRFSWNVVSIVDPLFTIPILMGILFSVYRKTRFVAQITFIYAVVFLCSGLIQKHRAEDALYSLAQQRGHEVQRVLVKPSFGNRHVWKLIYEHEGHYYVDAVKLLWETKIISGALIKKLNIDRDFPWLPENSQQAKDIERFRWFSDDFLAVSLGDPNVILDVRYSFLPNQIKLMWGIELEEKRVAAKHVNFITNSKVTVQDRKNFVDLVF